MWLILADHARGVVCTVLDRLAALLGLNQTINRLRSEVNELSRQNAQLSHQVEQLDSVQQKLEATEAQLRELSVLQDQSVDEMAAQVREFREIQQQMDDHLRAKVMQNLISVVLTADFDNDFVIDPEEIDHLELRLKTMDGVDFSPANFRKALVQSGYDPDQIDVRRGGFGVQAVLAVIRNLMDDSVPEQDNIFTIHAENLLSSK